MPISPEDRTRLIALARAAVSAEVAGAPLTVSDPMDGLLGEQRGCFVTLTNGGRLRGCIGTFHPRGPLGEMVLDMGAAAARDPRFTYNPITPRELGQLTIEVSVLSPLEETSEPLDLELGRHGIYIVRGARSGCFLPEVATDMGWTARQFLDECCSGKAGLPVGAWEMEGTKVYLFTSEKFAQ